MLQMLKIKPFFILLFSLLTLLPGLVVSAETKVLKDYHMTLYKDVQGSLDGFELFTKVEGKRAFFGLTCSIQSPLPLLQVILFDDEIMTDMTKLLSAKVFIDGVEQTLQLQGILKVVDTAEELSNKVRLEIVTERGSSLQQLQSQYKNLLNSLQKGQLLTIELNHRTLEPKDMSFSLQGLEGLLKPNQAVCF
ncbi:hypothetical protein [Thiomicrorhabdus sp. Kp2]|uniref:hypothetical protein n=1 Tax=Thiomicrorhabdus sp. Kp2 TaxID=1123518 RepID=UPI0003F4FE0C|nr:hypothetical protein [Thiomicrorhabdus sp. Kp2]